MYYKLPIARLLKTKCNVRKSGFVHPPYSAYLKTAKLLIPKPKFQAFVRPEKTQKIFLKKYAKYFGKLKNASYL